MRLMSILFVLAASLVGWGVAPASASPLCEKVWTDGYLLQPQNLGGCEPYGGATICRFQDVGADPQFHLYAEACVPAP